MKRTIRTAVAVVVCGALAVGCGATDAADGGGDMREVAESVQPALSDRPLDEIVSTRILPEVEKLFAQVRRDKLDTTVLGQRVFAPNSKDRFLPGKVANGFSYLLVTTAADDPRRADRLQGFREIADATVDVVNDSWGIYYYMSALWKLKKAGLLDGPDAAVSPGTLARLRDRLSWTAFVRPGDYSLIDLPTNYYGVAFSVARIRYLMGWEGPEASEALLRRTIAHYRTFSAFGFSDETDGAGRFDRYSVLLIGEIMQRIIETSMSVSAEDEAALKGWLRQSVNVIKPQLNPAGNGVSYGRSLGPYADTAFVEVLSAAEHTGVLDAQEKDMAYAFTTRVAAKYVQFWHDSESGSLNMWKEGRRVDSYRGIDRVLGENLSLTHQLIYTANLWKQAGYAQRVPMSTADFVGHLGDLPRSTLTRFAGFDGRPEAYDRGLFVYRDGLRVITLPVVNGAQTYHETNPYFPVPSSYNLLSGVADTGWPQLQPRFSVAGSSDRLIGSGYQKNLVMSESGKAATVTFEQDALDRVGGKEPVRDTRVVSTTEYRFEPGRITRTDVYTPSVLISGVDLEFGTYSTGVTGTDGNFRFSTGDVRSFRVEGLAHCDVVDVRSDHDYNTPTGPLANAVRCSGGSLEPGKPATIRWVLEYATDGAAGVAPS